MLDVPADKPETTPDEETVAMAVLLLLHVPPGVASLNCVVFPTTTQLAPVIGKADGVTVTILVVGGDGMPEGPDLTVTLYTPSAAKEIEGILIVAVLAVKPAGPVQLYTGVVAGELAVSVSVPF